MLFMEINLSKIVWEITEYHVLWKSVNLKIANHHFTPKCQIQFPRSTKQEFPGSLRRYIIQASKHTRDESLLSWAAAPYSRRLYILSSNHRVLKRSVAEAFAKKSAALRLALPAAQLGACVEFINSPNVLEVTTSYL